MNRRVLVVESHDGFRQLIGSFLSRAFEVTTTKNGLEAMIWLYKGLRPDVIVMDMRSPELNGIQLLSTLRCSGMFNHIPVVMIGAAQDSSDEQECKALGASEFIRKPFNPLYLQERLIHLTGPAASILLNAN